MEAPHSQSKKKSGYFCTKEYKESRRTTRTEKKDILSSPINIAENSDATTTSNKDCNEQALFIPCIVSIHGKTNAPKEQQLRRDFSLESSSTEIPTKDSVMTDLNISVEEEEWTTHYFQFLLNREMERLNELCKKWQEIKDKPKTTEDGQYQIHQAIGQTNLLINKKFERFRCLISNCERGKGEMSVTCTDLKGFWDVICIEVRNCNSRFERIENLRSRGWRELNEKFPSTPLAGAMRKRTITRKKVQNEARIKTPLIVIKISQMCKTLEVQLDNSVSYVNSDQTLRKSIPKQLKNSTETNNSSSEEFKDVHDSQQNSQINNIKHEDLVKIPCVTVQAATSITQVSSLKKILKRQNAVDENSEQCKDSPSNDINEENKIVRVLRNRTVYLMNTPQPKRESLRNKENKTPSRTKKSSCKVISKDKENIDLDKTKNDIDSSKINKKKKQSAKAVKCSGISTQTHSSDYQKIFHLLITFF